MAVLQLREAWTARCRVNTRPSEIAETNSSGGALQIFFVVVVVFIIKQQKEIRDKGNGRAITEDGGKKRFRIIKTVHI